MWLELRLAGLAARACACGTISPIRKVSFLLDCQTVPQIVWSLRLVKILVAVTVMVMIWLSTVGKLEYGWLFFRSVWLRRIVGSCASGQHLFNSMSLPRKVRMMAPHRANPMTVFCKVTSSSWIGTCQAPATSQVVKWKQEITGYIRKHFKMKENEKKKPSKPKLNGKNGATNVREENGG